VPLRPKPFAGLCYLVEHPGHLVTKEELNKAVWPGTYVGESSLKGYIRALREVFADDPAAPRFIETVARRGYRFIAPVTTTPPVSNVKFQVSSSLPFPASSPQNLTPNFVGREHELAQLQGWLGQGEEGIAQIRQGLAALRAVGRELAQMYFLALLAEAYERVGQAEEGLSTLAEALAVVSKTGERWYESELYRLKGTLTLQSQASPRQVSSKSQTRQDNSAVEKEAEECFWKAIEIARQQQAKSLELRAVMSLSRLWQSQGKTQQAHKMLTEIYGWFTEGFDTKDLQEAKALLKELNH